MPFLPFDRLTTPGLLTTKRPDLSKRGVAVCLRVACRPNPLTSFVQAHTHRVAAASESLSAPAISTVADQLWASVGFNLTADAWPWARDRL
jgi:hypothetical protein